LPFGPQIKSKSFGELYDTKCTGLGLGIAKNLRGGCTLAKHEVRKSNMFDLKVDYCHLDPKSRANHLEHFRTLNVTSLGLGIAKNERGCTLKFGLIW